MAAVPSGVIVDEVVATVRLMDSTSLLDPKLVRRLVQAVLAGADDRRASERRRRDNSRIGEDQPADQQAGW